MQRRRFHTLFLLSSLGLAVLLMVNLLPVLLVARQAFTPESESAGWPLALLPERFSLENLVTLWRAQSLVGHFARSFFVAAATTFLALLLGFPAGWAAARWRVLEGPAAKLSLASRILPPIAIAIPLVALLIPVRLYDHPLGAGLIIAHLAQGLPFAILLAYAAFREVPVELEEAAQVDGCTTIGTFARVALPAARGAIGGASILVFLLSWDEFTYALLIQLTNRTMPPLIYYYTEYGQLGAASVMAVLMLIPAILVIAILQRLVMRGALAGGVKG